MLILAPRENIHDFKNMRSPSSFNLGTSFPINACRQWPSICGTGHLFRDILTGLFFLDKRGVASQTDRTGFGSEKNTTRHNPYNTATTKHNTRCNFNNSSNSNNPPTRQCGGVLRQTISPLPPTSPLRFHPSRRGRPCPCTGSARSITRRHRTIHTSTKIITCEKEHNTSAAISRKQLLVLDTTTFSLTASFTSTSYIRQNWPTRESGPLSQPYSN